MDGREKFFNKKKVVTKDTRIMENYNANMKVTTVEDTDKELERITIRITKQNKDQRGHFREDLGENRTISYAGQELV